VAYAICGLIVILFRKLKAQWLLVLGLLAIAVPSLLYMYFGSSWNYMPPENQASIIEGWLSTPEKIANELRLFRSGWLDQMQVRIPAAIELQTFVFLINIGWRAAGTMLLGMALFKWDIITGKKSIRFYTIGGILGAVIGYPIITTGIIKNFAAEWSVQYSMFLGWQYNYWGSLFVAFAYVCLIMLVFKALQKYFLGQSLIAVGRMAFTNYIMQSIICTFIFYGHGLGLFGQVGRVTQITIVLIIWILQLIYSPLWLKHFRFGPLEWLWRSLTYAQMQPLKLK
jgi:uncharacterized protein